MRRAERWLFAAGTAERLAAVRIGLCATLAWRLTRDVYVGVAGQPAALYRPRSFMGLLSAQPSRGVAIAIQAAGIAAALLATVGLRTRVAVPAAWAAGMFLNGMVTSNGKIMHNDVLLLLAMVPLLAAPAGDAWSVDAARRGRPALGPSDRYGWPVRTAMLVVAFGYFFCGFAKLVHSGPAWVTSGNMRWIMYASSDSQVEPNALALLIAARPWLAHLAAAGALAVELGFPLFLLRLPLAPAFAGVAVGLHAGIWLTMGLDYRSMAATAVIVLVDWPAALERFSAAREARRERKRGQARVLPPPRTVSRAGSESPAGDG